MKPIEVLRGRVYSAWKKHSQHNRPGTLLHLLFRFRRVMDRKGQSS